MKRNHFYAGIFMLFFSLVNQQLLAVGFDRQLADFQIRVNDLLQPYKTFAFTVLPNQWLEIKTESDNITLSSVTGESEQTDNRIFRWRNKEIGGPYLVILTDHKGAKIDLNIFVLTPYSELKNGHLEKYRIDNYPKKRLKDNPIYAQPKGFIRVTKENRDTPVSPNFTLSQFISKQLANWPKFTVLNPNYY